METLTMINNFNVIRFRNVSVFLPASKFPADTFLFFDKCVVIPLQSLKAVINQKNHLKKNLIMALHTI